MKHLHSLSENEFLQKLVIDQSFLFHFFNFVLEPALGSHRKGWDYVIFVGVKREWLGLIAGEKPGDIDILIVPIRNEKMHLDKCMALEVKRLFIPRNNRRKDARSSGFAQAQGLFRDGFPYVGLLHVLFTDPTPPTEWEDMTVAQVIDEQTQEVELLPNRRVDTILSKLEARQFDRLCRRAGNGLIGLNAKVVTPSKNGVDIGGITTGSERCAGRNPDISRDLLSAIADLTNSKIGEFRQSSKASAIPPLEK